MTTRLRERTWTAVHALLGPNPQPVGSDIALVATRTVLTWIFVYYGAGKLFGAFNGPGIHRTSIYFADTAHLHPGGFFAVLGGVIEFGGALCVGLGLATRLAGLALLGDQIMAMITVTWTNGINSLTTRAGYEFNMTLAVLALIVVIFGAGRLSVDAVIERRARRFFVERSGRADRIPQDSPATVHHSSLS
jgi:putative oxidoreductase